MEPLLIASSHLARRVEHQPRVLAGGPYDLLIVDDFCLDVMDATESRDAHEILRERHRAGSMVITSNRGPDEWLATFADPVRAQSAIDRFTSNSYDLVIDGESYRKRQKPGAPTAKKKESKS